MKYQIILLAVLLVSTLQQSHGQHIHCTLEENFSSKQRSEEETQLKYRPIQQNILIQEDRQETLKIEVRDDIDVGSIEAEYLLFYGETDRLVHYDEVEFERIGDSNVFEASISLIHDDWIKTYLIKSLRLGLSFYDNHGQIIGSEYYDLTYIDVDSDYLESARMPNITVLTPDSTVIHLENSVYIDFDKVRHINETGHYEIYYDNDYRIYPLLDSIWEEPLFSIPGTGELGLQDLNSSVYSIPLSGGSGNYFFFNFKSASTAGFIILSRSTFVHELFHMFQGHFFDYFIHEVEDSPIYKIGNFNHNPIQFFGQSAFGRNYPIPDSYPNLCPSELNNIKETSTGYKVTISKPCQDTNLNLVDGIPASVHSNFELFIMDLADESEIDSVMYFGFNTDLIEFEESSDSIAWTFDTLVALTREQIVSMKETWYNRDNGAFKDYYDAKSKNLLITYHAGGKRTLEELKMLHVLSNELIAERPEIEIPDYARWGYENEVYDRYISYEQATLGLGKLTNGFPLPPSYTMTTSNDNDSTTDTEILIYPNPATDEVTIEGVDPDLVEIYGMDGTHLFTRSKSSQIKLPDLSTGVYLLVITYQNYTHLQMFLVNR